MGHFYTTDGKPMHRIVGANGKERDTTLRDARKLNLIESVTSVLGIFDKPGLNIWKENKLLANCGAHRREEGEPHTDYATRIRQLGAIDSNKNMDFGSIIHDRIERALSGETLPLEQVETPLGEVRLIGEFVNPVLELFKDNNWRVLELETVLVGRGYAGTADCIYAGDDEYGIIDFKTCKDAEKAKPSPEYMAQIALYHQAEHGGIDDKAAGYNIFISRDTNIGSVKAVRYDAEMLRKYLELGQLAVRAKQIMTGYIPNQEEK
jgi:hypothetical protein